MKIGIVCPYNMIKGGGVQEIVKNQAVGLRVRGHDVTVITPRPPEYDGPVPNEYTVFVGRSRDMRLVTGTTIQVSSNGSDEIEEFMRTHDFDILHFHEPWVPSLGTYMLPRAKEKGIVTVATFHAKLPDGITARAMGEMFRPFAKSVIKDIDMFAAASVRGSEYISSMTDKPVALVPVDIDLTKFKRAEQFDDDRPHKTILYIGRLERRKGVKYLIRAFAELKMLHPDIQLDLLGDGVARASLQGLVRGLGVDGVHFLGFRSNEEKFERLRNADLFCVPSIYGEGFGMVLLEGMATGVPTIAGDNPGYASVMTGFGALSLIDPHDTRAFARLLELFLYEKELRKAWRAWAANEVEQYNTKHMLDKYEALYREAFKNKQHKPANA
jgi:phosphatidylinositol alpha-mannosyltransferase